MTPPPRTPRSVAALALGVVVLAAVSPALGQESAPTSEPETAAEPEKPAEPEATPPQVKPKPKPKRAAVNLRGTETFIAEYVGDNGNGNEALTGDDDNYSTYRNLFYFQASNRQFDSALRLDATLFHNPPGRVTSDEFVPGGDGYTTLDYGNDFRVERIHGTAHVGNLHVTMGDFYVNFGRGMALSLIKLDDVGVDNSLRGIRVEYRVPRKVKAVLVGGVVNSLNLDPLTHQVQRDDPLDRIAGARVEWELADAISLGGHGVFLDPRFTEEASIDPDRLYIDQGPGVSALNGGASLEMHLEGLHMYLEGNGQKHDNFRPPEGSDDVMDESGWAVFAEASYDLAPFNLKGEGIFYRRWLMEGPFRGSAPNIGATQPLGYHHMVTLEPLWMPIKSFGNAGGGRLTGDLYLRESDTQLTLSAAIIQYFGGLMPQGQWEDHPPTMIIHPILKLRQGFEETGIDLSAEGGFRYEGTDEPFIEGEESGKLWHAQGDVSFPLTGPHSVEVKAEVRRHMLDVTEGGDNHYWVTLTSLGYDWSGLFGITGVYEYSDETAGAQGQIGQWEVPLPLQHYVWALVTIHPPSPLDGLTLRLLGGSQRGGIKCAGGICRRYPDAVGGKLEAVYRF